MPLAEGGNDFAVEDLRSIKCRRDLPLDKALGNKIPRIESEVGHSKVKHNSLRGITLGFVNEQLDVVRNTTSCWILS
jgi:hypothetical protein